jgi:molybdopterin-guanine dinucleotide biosynthesis protein MobB
MDRLLAIIGRSGSGKTTLIEALVPELKQRGYRLGTLKHTHHSPEFDTVGKDSWRHFAAGVETAVLWSSERFFVVKRREPSASVDDTDIKELTGYFADVDLVIAEGLKYADCPKIEVYRQLGKGPPLCRSLTGVIAVVSDLNEDFPVPCFSAESIKEIAHMIEERFPRNRM